MRGGVPRGRAEAIGECVSRALAACVLDRRRGEAIGRTKRYGADCVWMYKSLAARPHPVRPGQESSAAQCGSSCRRLLAGGLPHLPRLTCPPWPLVRASVEAQHGCVVMYFLITSAPRSCSAFCCSALAALQVAQRGAVICTGASGGHAYLDGGAVQICRVRKFVPLSRPGQQRGDAPLVIRPSTCRIRVSTLQAACAFVCAQGAIDALAQTYSVSTASRAARYGINHAIHDVL